MSNLVTTQPDGFELDLDSYAVTLGYTGNNVTTLTVVTSDNTYVQTITYSGNNVTNISGWVQQ